LGCEGILPDGVESVGASVVVRGGTFKGFGGVHARGVTPGAVLGVVGSRAGRLPN
jgi:hypothetical protein